MLIWVVVKAILPTQNPRFPLVVALDCWMVLRDYLVLIYLVLWFFIFFGVIFDVKTAKIETELSPIFTGCTRHSLKVVGYYSLFFAGIN